MGRASRKRSTPPQSARWRWWDTLCPPCRLWIEQPNPYAGGCAGCTRSSRSQPGRDRGILNSTPCSIGICWQTVREAGCLSRAVGNLGACRSLPAFWEFLQHSTAKKGISGRTIALPGASLNGRIQSTVRGNTQSAEVKTVRGCC